MADLIKKIKIKKQDGTFTDYIPIGAEAQNISTSDGDSVQLKLNKKPYYYNSVADMKADTKLKVGDMAVTLGYYEANDSGGAEYKIVSGTYTDDGGSHHELDNSLWAELIYKNNIANIRQFGAKGDGITDDAPKIRAAIAFLKTLNGGTLYLPSGEYYANSGDPRGLNGQGVFSNGDYYTCFEIISNMSVIGEGVSNTILKYNPNRLGYNLNTNKGDVGAVFANHRVTDSGAAGLVINGTVKFSNFKVVYTDLVSGEKDNRDYIDGQFIKIYTKNFVQNTHGNLIVEDMEINNHVGHQVFHFTGGQYFFANNIKINECGTATNSADSDFSAYFINTHICNITNCAVSNATAASGTAYELHSTNVLFENNYAKNVSTFMNVVGNVEGYGSYYQVNNNIADRVINFLNLWTYEERYLKSVNAHNNEIILRYKNDITTESLIRISNDTAGGISANCIPLDLVNFSNNNAKTIINNEDPNVSSTTYSNAAITFSNVKKIIFENNHIENFRRGAMRIVDVGKSHLIEAHVNNNAFKNIAMKIPENGDSVYKTCIHFNPSNLYGANQVKKYIEIKNNNIDITNVLGAALGIFLNIWHGVTNENLTKINVIDNNIYVSSANNVEEIKVNANSTNSFDKGIYLKHTYNKAITNPSAAMVANGNANISNYVTGSQVKGICNNGLITVTKYYSSYWIVEGYTWDVPTEGYWSKGSVLKHPLPTFNSTHPYEWICTASGTPGTWSPVTDPTDSSGSI